MVIAAAKRGARGHGVEFNPNMVELSNRLARQAGVGDMARFIEGDMFVADISCATVLPLFLLSENLNQLTPNFLKLRPGTRIVSNGFLIDGWAHDESATAAGDCGHWCCVFLYIVPAQAGGAWRLGEEILTINQEFQKFTGRLGAITLEGGRVNGAEITFTAGKTRFTGRITGDEMRGEAKGARPGSWSARRE